MALAGALATAVAGHRYAWPKPVESWRVAAAPFAIERTGPATLDATGRAAVGARVQGRIAAVAVDRNDRVAAGDPIASLEADDLRNELAAAAAAWEAAGRAAEEAEADLARARAVLANASAAFERQADLRTRGWGTRAEYDAALAARRQAEADHARAEAALRRAVAQERSAAAQEAVGRAHLDEATVRAPFSGVVVSRDLNPGDVATPGAAIVHLVDPATIVVTARFDDSLIATLRPGQEARLAFASEPDAAIHGRVLRLGRSVDEETREFTVDIVPDRLPANWAIGQRGSAVVTVAVHPDALAVPGGCVVWRNGRSGLWVARNGRAAWRPVTLGEAAGGAIEVRDGLSPGDEVLAPDGVYRWMPVRRTGAAS
ncbi:efflux RND transporter periplasmic adaptor subunit [Azospirillum sp. A39]|uniref:efflux RND transporter periplasmic adaptor subunit n=1 Tax=Azospirillum sp. A39 TaxID=3462279 RepID=UPI0040458B15